MEPKTRQKATVLRLFRMSSTTSGKKSHMATWWPFPANVWANAVPMFPAPSTAILVRTDAGTALHRTRAGERRPLVMTG